MFRLAFSKYAGLKPTLPINNLFRKDNGSDVYYFWNVYKQENRITLDNVGVFAPCEDILCDNIAGSTR